MIIRDVLCVSDDAQRVEVSSSELQFTDPITGSKKLSQLGGYGSESYFKDFTYSEDIIKGKFVNLLSSGKIAKAGTITGSVAIPYNGQQQFYNQNVSSMSVTFDPFNPDRFAIVYEGFVYGVYDYVAVVIGTVSNTDVLTFGPENIIETTLIGYVQGVFDPFVKDRLIMTYAKEQAGYGYARVAIISGTTVTAGIAYQYYSNTAFNPVLIADPLVIGRFAVIYRDQGALGKVRPFTAGTSGTTITMGIDVTFSYSTVSPPAAVWDRFTADKLYIAYTTGTTAVFIVGTFTAGTTNIFANTAVNVQTTTPLVAGACFYTYANRILFLYKTSSSLVYRFGTISGTTATFGTEVVILNTTVDSYSMQIDLRVGTKALVTYIIGTDLRGIVGTISGDTISFGSSFLIASGATTTAMAQDLFYDGRLILAYTTLTVGQAMLGRLGINFTNVYKDRLVGVTITDALANATTAVQMEGNCTQFTGLTPGSIYYLDSSGALTTTATNVRVGIATSTTSMRLITY